MNIFLFKGNIPRLLLALLLFLIKHSPVWILPVYIKFLVDELSQGQFKIENILWPSIVMLFLILQNILTHTWFSRLLSLVLREMESQVRIVLIEQIQKLPYSYISSNSAAVLQNKVLRDVENLTLMLGNIIQNIFPSIITIILAVILTLQSSWILTLVFALLAPLAILLQKIFWKRLHEKNAAFRKDIETMNGKVLELIELTPVIRAHALEKNQTEQIKSKFLEVKQKGLSLDLIVAWFGSSAWVVFMSAQLIILIILALLVDSKILSIGDIVLFQTYFTGLIGSLNSLMNLLPDLAKGKESLNSIKEIIHFEDLDDDEGKTKLTNIEGNIRFEGVSFSHEKSTRHALSDLSLEIRAGETIALVGESGSGKSTFSQLLLGFYKPSSGKIYIDNLDLSTINKSTYRSHISVVTQETRLSQGSVLENVAFGQDNIDLAEVIQALKKAYAYDFVMKLPEGLNTDLGIHGGKLSGGQRQRISIARALFRNPKILILDEATSALDQNSEAEVKKAIDEACKDRTVIIIAHRLSTIEGADKVVELQEGKLVRVKNKA